MDTLVAVILRTGLYAAAYKLWLAPPTDNARGILASMLARVKQAGVDHDQRFAFAEICHRSPRRYDVHLGDGSSESEFSSLVNALVHPVLALCGSRVAAQGEAAAVRIVRDGLVTSLPGANAQPFHADGRGHGLYNAFLPLVALRTQGTEFWLASHLDESAVDHVLSSQTREYIGEGILEDANIEPHICAPVLDRAEGIILFDYRIFHRGRSHDSGELGPRPIFYRVYAVDGVAEDTHNWGKQKLP